jgi:hypothetical protein
MQKFEDGFHGVQELDSALQPEQAYHVITSDSIVEAEHLMREYC